MDPRDRLSAWIDWSGLSQQAVADRIGCTQAFVSQLRRRQKRLTSVTIAVAIRDMTAEMRADGATWGPGPIEVTEWVDTAQPQLEA